MTLCMCGHPASDHNWTFHNCARDLPTELGVKYDTGATVRRPRVKECPEGCIAFRPRCNTDTKDL